MSKTFSAKWSAIFGRFKSFLRSFSTIFGRSLQVILQIKFYLKSHLFISSATSQPILRWSHHRSRHSNAPQPPMLIVSYNNTVREKSCHISQRLHNSLSTSLSASLNKLSPACLFLNKVDTLKSTLFKKRHTKHTSLGQCRNNHHTIMLVLLIRLRIAADTLGIDA